MKFFKLILSLHSLRLIAISALAIAYLAMTTANGPNKTEAMEQESASIVGKESKSLKVENAEVTEARIEIRPIASQQPDLEKK